MWRDNGGARARRLLFPGVVPGAIGRGLLRSRSNSAVEVRRTGAASAEGVSPLFFGDLMFWGSVQHGAGTPSGRARSRTPWYVVSCGRQHGPIWPCSGGVATAQDFQEARSIRQEAHIELCLGYLLSNGIGSLSSTFLPSMLPENRPKNLK